jgi:hypothetical protein
LIFLSAKVLCFTSRYDPSSIDSSNQGANASVNTLTTIIGRSQCTFHEDLRTFASFREQMPRETNSKTLEYCTLIFYRHWPDILRKSRHVVLFLNQNMRELGDKKCFDGLPVGSQPLHDGDSSSFESHLPVYGYRPSEYSVKKCNFGFARYLPSKQKEFVPLGEIRFKIIFEKQNHLSHGNLIAQGVVSTPLTSLPVSFAGSDGIGDVLIL